MIVGMENVDSRDSKKPLKRGGENSPNRRRNLLGRFWLAILALRIETHADTTFWSLFIALNFPIPTSLAGLSKRSLASMSSMTAAM